MAGERDDPFDPRSSILDPLSSPLEQAAPAVLERYPGPTRQGSVVPLGNRGRFSLARLHTAWQTQAEAAPAPCPALRRQLDCIREWHDLVRSGWHPLARAAADDPTRPVAERARRVLARWAGRVPGRLQPWAAARWR